MSNAIFVFGSNLAGRHGKGAALFALKNRGAIKGQGRGHQGDSYAIPTKGYELNTLPLDQIRHHVAEFLAYARQHPELDFQLSAIGCGLAGYQPSDIGPMFLNSPPNVILPDEFQAVRDRGRLTPQYGSDHHITPRATIAKNATVRRPRHRQ